MSNLDKYTNIGTHWIALYVKDNEVIYFNSFGAEYIPKEIKKSVRHKDIKTSVFRIQTYNPIMCGYFCVLFSDYVLAK